MFERFSRNARAAVVLAQEEARELSAEEIEAALNFWKKETTGKAKMRDVMQMALGIAKVPGGIAFEGVAATGWIG